MKGDPLDAAKDTEDDQRRPKSTFSKLRTVFIDFLRWLLEFTEICNGGCLERINNYLEEEKEILSDDDEAKAKEEKKIKHKKKKKKARKGNQV